MSSVVIWFFALPQLQRNPIRGPSPVGTQSRKGPTPVGTQSHEGPSPVGGPSPMRDQTSRGGTHSHGGPPSVAGPLAVRGPTRVNSDPLRGSWPLSYRQANLAGDHQFQDFARPFTNGQNLG